MAALGPPKSGPTDPVEVADLLVDDEAVNKAIDKYRPQWIASVQPSWPLLVRRNAWAVDAYFTHTGTSGNIGMPPTVDAVGTLPSDKPNASSTPSLPSSDKAADASLPAGAFVPLPFATASDVGSAHQRRVLPQPKKFDKISLEHDYESWLTSTEEYLSLAGFAQNQWAVLASYFLDKLPLRRWQSHKKELLAAHGLKVYSWDHFREWTLEQSCLYDHEQHAIQKLSQLKQTGSAAEYKSAHDALAAQTKLPMAARMFFWNSGLKLEMRDACKIDPVTHSAKTDIAKAQKAAVAADAHVFAAAVNARKRSASHGGRPSLAAVSVKPKTIHYTDYSKADGKFECAKTGTLKETPSFMKTWMSTLPINGNSHLPLLPKDMVKSDRTKGGCYYKDCTEDHSWRQCAKLPHRMYHSTVSKK